jgi:hypothetical protein
MKVFALLLICSFLINVDAHANSQFGMNDVSILVPLPTSQIEQMNSEIGPSFKIVGGDLLPFNLMQSIEVPMIQPALQSDVRGYETFQSLTVVGVRLDPCFKDNFSDKCRPQVRLILQVLNPVTTDPRLPLGALDMGVHLFFDVSESTILNMITALRNVRRLEFEDSNYIQEPLGVSPIIKKQGTSGAYFLELKSKLSTLKVSQLSRVAFLMTDPGDGHWMFRTYNVNNETLTPLSIPDLMQDQYQVFNNIVSDPFFKSSVETLPIPKTNTDQLFDFLNDSEKFKNETSIAQKAQFLNSIQRIENPNVHLPGTIDCVSCHATMAIKSSLVLTKTVKNINGFSYKSKTMPTRATNTDSKNFVSSNLHVFSYFGSTPSIGQRVVNESAIVADYLNSLN